MNMSLRLEPQVGIEPTTACLCKNSRWPLRGKTSNQNPLTVPPIYGIGVSQIGRRICNRLQPGQRPAEA